MQIFLVVVFILNSYVLYLLAKDLNHNRLQIAAAYGKMPLQMLYAFILFFLNAFGISDFILSTIVYHKTGWVETKKVPGTLSCQSLLPLLVMSTMYILGVKMSMLTFIPFAILQAVGSWIGPQVVAKMPVRLLKKLMAASLILAAGYMLINMLGLMHSIHVATGLGGWRLIVICCCGFCFGMLKSFGIGCYPLTMAVVYLLGLNPMIAYPLMMGSAALSVPVAASQFIKLDAYSRRLAFCGSTAGAVGAVIAVLLVKKIDIAFLQWIILIVICFAAFDMLRTTK